MAPPPATTGKVFSLDDCKAHTSDKDCWLVVHGEAACRRQGRLYLTEDGDERHGAARGVAGEPGRPRQQQQQHGAPVPPAAPGKVYDVTAFLEEHPGGYDVILTSSGERGAGSGSAAILPRCPVAQTPLAAPARRQGCYAGL